MVGIDMNYETFTYLHSETIKYCQIIEGDLKWIYSFMHVGDIYETRDSLDSLTFGQIVRKLKQLDNSDGNPELSASDYNFLGQMAQKRNYWCHECYRDFVYQSNWLHSTQYAKACDKLQRDHDKLEVVCRNVENLKLKLNRS